MSVHTKKRLNRSPGAVQSQEETVMGTISVTCKRTVKCPSPKGAPTQPVSTSGWPLLVAKCTCSSRLPPSPSHSWALPALLQLMGLCSLYSSPAGCESSVIESSTHRQSWRGRSTRNCYSPVRGWPSRDASWRGTAWSGSGWSASACAWSSCGGASKNYTMSRSRGPMTTGGKPHRASLPPLRCPVAFRTVPCPPEPC